jgi:hypothetical protein
MGQCKPVRPGLRHSPRSGRQSSKSFLARKTLLPGNPDPTGQTDARKTNTSSPSLPPGRPKLSLSNSKRQSCPHRKPNWQPTVRAPAGNHMEATRGSVRCCRRREHLMGFGFGVCVPVGAIRTGAALPNSGCISPRIAAGTTIRQGQWLPARRAGRSLPGVRHRVVRRRRRRSGAAPGFANQMMRAGRCARNTRWHTVFQY